jgi:hypothetical protein
MSCSQSVIVEGGITREEEDPILLLLSTELIRRLHLLIRNVAEAEAEFHLET